MNNTIFKKAKMTLLVLSMAAALGAGAVHAGEAEITLKSSPSAAQPTDRQTAPARPSAAKGDVTLKRGVVDSSSQPDGTPKPGQTPGSVQAPEQTPAGLLLPAVQKAH